MARRSVSASNRRIDLGPIIEQLGEALCIVEVSINSLESSESGSVGPELPALQCALKKLNSVHAQLGESYERPPRTSPSPSTSAVPQSLAL
jgi:hypothetical protein